MSDKLTELLSAISALIENPQNEEACKVLYDALKDKVIEDELIQNKNMFIIGANVTMKNCILIDNKVSTFTMGK